MTYPKNYFYTKDHEWVLFENGIATVGITNYAQAELGELVFVELPKVGTAVKAGNTFCVVESTKAASDVYSPLSGTVLEINSELNNVPNLINQEPHLGGWIAKLSNVQEEEVQKLLKVEQYEKLVNA